MAEVKIPDIGDFEEVEIIEVLVSEGDEVLAEDPLITVESDKATMEIPAPQAGTVTALKVAVGDKVSEGSVIMEITPGEESPEHPTPETVSQESVEAVPQPENQESPAPEAATRTESSVAHVDNMLLVPLSTRRSSEHVHHPINIVG